MLVCLKKALEKLLTNCTLAVSHERSLQLTRQHSRQCSSEPLTTSNKLFCGYSSGSASSLEICGLPVAAKPLAIRSLYHL